MDKRIAEEFLEKFSKNQHSEQEHQIFLEWLKEAPAHQQEEILETYGQFFKSIPEDGTVRFPDLVKNIEANLDTLPVNDGTAPVKLWADLRMVAGAAAVFLCLITGIYFFHYKSQTENLRAVNSAKIVPGSNKAVLTLANGKEMILDDSQTGVIGREGNSIINKSKDGKLIYTLSDKKEKAIAGFNTVTTPKGGVFEIILPDGSKVWLNAASSLKFPASFKGEERRVELKGEAYFEVTKNKKMPFRVIAGKAEIEVLGTHFNVMAYKDTKESEITTTLIEGSVKVIEGKKSILIKPGEQAKVNKSIDVSKVNATEAVEWKNGNFNFSHESFESIMNKIARWYNVEIEYEGEVTKEEFVGTVPRSEDISEVLKRLELTGLVHFKIKERRIIVMP